MKDKKPIRLYHHEHLIIVGLYLVGAVRLFLFNAAFPLFNNVDEQLHFDIMYRYAHADIPRAGVERYNHNALELMMLYNSPEYTSSSQNISRDRRFWTVPNVQKSEKFVQFLNAFEQKYANIEAGSFPIYYALAGVWYNIGNVLGLTGGWLLYWVRFLNVPVFVMLVWVSYLVASSLYPQDDQARLALPLIVTFYPQDSFYSITNDSLSPLLFSIVFYMLLQIYHREKSYVYYFTAGLFIAATFLTKISNITVFALVLFVLTLKLRRSYLEKEAGQYLPKLFVLSTAAIVPVAIWLTRNYLVMGDALANAAKIMASGWTIKPMSQWLNHPLFTPGGLGFFLAELTRTFWRGEIIII